MQVNLQRANKGMTDFAAARTAERRAENRFLASYCNCVWF